MVRWKFLTSRPSAFLLETSTTAHERLRIRSCGRCPFLGRAARPDDDAAWTMDLEFTRSIQASQTMSRNWPDGNNRHTPTQLWMASRIPIGITQGKTGVNFFVLQSPTHPARVERRTACGNADDTLRFSTLFRFTNRREARRLAIVALQRVPCMLRF